MNLSSEKFVELYSKTRHILFELNLIYIYFYNIEYTLGEFIKFSDLNKFSTCLENKIYCINLIFVK